MNRPIKRQSFEETEEYWFKLTLLVSVLFTVLTITAGCRFLPIPKAVTIVVGIFLSIIITSFVVGNRNAKMERQKVILEKEPALSPLPVTLVVKKKQARRIPFVDPYILRLFEKKKNEEKLLETDSKVPA